MHNVFPRAIHGNFYNPIHIEPFLVGDLETDKATLSKLEDVLKFIPRKDTCCKKLSIIKELYDYKEQAIDMGYDWPMVENFDSCDSDGLFEELSNVKKFIKSKI